LSFRISIFTQTGIPWSGNVWPLFVRFQLFDCGGCEPLLICWSRISFGLGEALMAKNSHYLFGSASCLCKPPSSGLAQPMWLAFKRQSCSFDCGTHKPVNSERVRKMQWWADRLDEMKQDSK
jgi:hypothetical protein